ncbi:DUF3300 domain-containing protein [Alkalimonas sp.]|uniref:DUF3300 domain-containing protein n=1 Tax=Alkalimonas sp. TaxID=1872453 RepID=UPI00263AA902|nr:DUF3300 domain-containing protein [Alkalimonas sp.]MCC5826478.1 DUF3300 domain-containing protein [Alkalimonas sp.]
MSDLARIFSFWLPLVLGTMLLSQAAKAQDESFEQAQLDQVLAPIALYPDSILSHVLIASTYPLEVVQAARWVAQNPELDSETALQQVEQHPWDPSVKALVAFPDLLERMSDDLDWLEQLGEAFLTDETWVMQSIQQLRERAYAHGAFDEVEHIVVQREQHVIVIEPRQREVVYVPYYNTRVVYGDWWWPHHQPYYWHYPGAYYTHSAFYWGPYYRVTPRFYFSSFHWHHRHVIVNHHHFYHPPRYYPTRVVHVHHGKRWQHNPVHRRGVVYRREALSRQYDSRPRSTTREERGPAREWRRPRAQPSGDYSTSFRQHARSQQRTEQEQRQEYDRPDRSQQRSRSLRADATPQQHESNLQQRREQLQVRQQTTTERSANLNQRQQQLAERQERRPATDSAAAIPVREQRQRAAEYRGAREVQQSPRTTEYRGAREVQQNQSVSNTQPAMQQRPQVRNSEQQSPARPNRQIEQRAMPQPEPIRPSSQPQQRTQRPVEAIRSQSTVQPQPSTPNRVQSQPSAPSRVQSSTPAQRPQRVERSANPRPQVTERSSRGGERRQRQID